MKRPLTAAFLVLLVVMLVLGVASSALAKQPNGPAGFGAGKPSDVGKPADAGKPPDVGKPADAGKPPDVGKPADAGKPPDVGKPSDVGKPLGSGAGKAKLYDSEAFTCPMGATDLTGRVYGFVVLNTNRDGDLIVQVSLKRATPHADYDIWVNQDPGGCPLAEATAIGVLHTNRVGNGNAHLKIERLEEATKFWASVVGGGLVLRSTAVELD